MRKDIVMKFILASKSPRRKEILENIGLDFQIIVANADETCFDSNPSSYVKTVATRKGQAVFDLLNTQGKMTEDTIIIASDTIVVCENQILGKPKNPEDAARMLRMFSGKTHSVISGIALLSPQKTVARAETTLVHFDTVPKREIEQYIATSEPYDKAGAYAIQGFASLWITGITGDYFNVVGFPIKCFSTLLYEEYGLSLANLVKKS